MSVFGSVYSQAYDALYEAKDYERECAMIEALANINASATILDLGCGTGGHAVRLAKKSYKVIGIDLSTDMLAMARAKATAAGVGENINWIASDIRTIDLGQVCDAAIMMFAVLGYQKSDEDVHAALRSVARHLHKGAPLVFDIWFGPGVLADLPGKRRKVINTATGRIIRTTESVMDPEARLCTVNFHLENFFGDALVSEVRESHVMRYFFPEDLVRFASAAGFSCERINDFNDLNKGADSTTWNAIALFRKC